MHPTVTIHAKGAIFNPEYELPTSSGFSVGPGGATSHWDESVNRVIVEPCKLTLDTLGVAVLFGKNTLTTFVKDEKGLLDGTKYGWLEHLRNFIIYKSRVNYNIFCNWFDEKVASFGACPEVDRVITFNLYRLTGEQGIKKVGDEYVALGVEPFGLTIDRTLFDTFHKLLDRGLARAITYFLIASENPMYFLVEYYKCMEVIKQEFGRKNAESAMLRALSPHGFNKKLFKKLGDLANADRLPLAFGRHAPKRDANIIGMDHRDLYSRTIQRELFDESTKICRACIDAYIAYLGAGA